MNQDESHKEDKDDYGILWCYLIKGLRVLFGLWHMEVAEVLNVNPKVCWSLSLTTAINVCEIDQDEDSHQYHHHLHTAHLLS